MTGEPPAPFPPSPFQRPQSPAQPPAAQPAPFRPEDFQPQPADPQPGQPQSGVRQAFPPQPEQAQPWQAEPWQAEHWPAQPWPAQPGQAPVGQPPAGQPTGPGFQVPPPWPPEPPRGPGVRAPFAAPPTERNRRRMWIGLGVGGAALLLCCVGGVVGVGALVVTTGQATVNESRTAVRDYLDGLARHNYREAYDQLCTARRNRESLDEFADRESTLPPVEGFAVGHPQLRGSGFQVPTTVQTEGGTDEETYTVISDRQTGALKVCDGPR